MQKEIKSSIPEPQEEEFYFRQVISDRKQDLYYLLGFKKWFALILVLGALAGALVAWLRPITYTARLTFVVEEAQTGGGNMLSALAGQFGFDLGNMGSGSGVLAGDNVQELLKSNKIIKSALLTPFNGNAAYSLADRYADANELKEGWKKYSKEGKPVSFPVNDQNYTRLQDSLLQVIIKNIKDAELGVSKTDKKLTFFELNVTTRDEKFSQLFTNRLIKEATEFYTQTKTSRLRTNIARLQHRADSITRLLNRKTYTAQAANQVLLDLNPAYPTANVGVEVSERDKMVLATIYGEVVKNLEVSNTILMQETPIFQIVDEPGLPLKKNRLGYLKAIVIGMFVSGVLLTIYLLFVKK